MRVVAIFKIAKNISAIEFMDKFNKIWFLCSNIILLALRDIPLHIDTVHRNIKL